MAANHDSSDSTLRAALEANGHRFTEQRAAVYRFLAHTNNHPTADEVFLTVRSDVPGISLATVYKSLETLVGCGLATRLCYSDGSARYDGRTDPHHHTRCRACGSVSDIPGHLPDGYLQELHAGSGSFRVMGYRLELTGYCVACAPALDVGVPRTSA